MALKEGIGQALSHPSTRDHLASQVGGDATTGEKVSKQDANYRVADSPDESCGTCIHFDGKGGCEIVAGSINQSHVSDHYSSTKGKDGGDSSSGDSKPADQADSTDQSAP